MPFCDAYADRKYQQIQQETWGYLAPEPGKVYYGEVTFAHAAYGGETAFLSIEFKTKDGKPLQDSPWSFEDIADYITTWICDQANGYRDGKPIPYSQRIECEGKVITFIGSYTRFKSDGYRITGRFQECKVT
jgi:hypothetical protein